MINHKESEVIPRIEEAPKKSASSHKYRISIGALIEERYAARLGNPVFPITFLNKLRLAFEDKHYIKNKKSREIDSYFEIDSLISQDLSQQLAQRVQSGGLGTELKYFYERANKHGKLKILVIDMSTDDFFSKKVIGSEENQSQRMKFLEKHKFRDGTYAVFSAMCAYKEEGSEIYVFKESTVDVKKLSYELGHELAHAAYTRKSFGTYGSMIGELAPMAWEFTKGPYSDLRVNVSILSILFDCDIFKIVKESIAEEIPEEHIVTSLSKALGNRATMLFLCQIPDPMSRVSYKDTIFKNFDFNSLNKYYLKLAYQELGEEVVDKNIRKYLDSKVWDYNHKSRASIGFYEYVKDGLTTFTMSSIPEIYINKILVVTKEHYTDDGKSKVTVPDRTKKDGPLFNGPIKNSELKKLSKQMPTVTRFKEYCANLISIHFILLEKLVLKFVS